MSVDRFLAMVVVKDSLMDFAQRSILLNFETRH